MRHTGRPAGESANHLLAYVKSIIPPSLLPDEDKAPCYDPTQAYGLNLCCPICCSILDRPLELLCYAVICLSCCCKWIQVNPSLSCPCCYTHSLSSYAIKQPSSLLITLLENLPIICVRGCDKVVKLVDYRSHLEGKCKSHYQHDLHSPSHMTLQDVLNRPTSAPSTPTDDLLTEHYVRRLFEPDSTGNQGIAKVKTRGQVRIDRITQHD